MGDCILNDLGRQTHGDGFNRGLWLHMQEAVGNVAQAFNVSQEIRRVAFNQPRNLDGDRIAEDWVVKHGHDFGFRQTGELWERRDNAGHGCALYAG